MNYEPQRDDEDITTLRITKRVRRKLGMCINKNETMDEGLERILDKHGPIIDIQIKQAPMSGESISK